jgi:hypothetical protein
VQELVLNLQFTYTAIGAQQDSLSRYFCLDVPRLKQGLLCRKLFHNDIIDAALTLSCFDNKQQADIAGLRFGGWETELCPQNMRNWRTK